MNNTATDPPPPPSSWDLNDERELLITMLNQRFQFLLLFVSLVANGAVSAKQQSHLQVLLTFGATVGWMVTYALALSQRRLDFILDALRKDRTHPYTAVCDGVGSHRRAQAVLSYWVATVCCLALSAAAAAAFAGWLRAAN
jgi:hypothetical protein